MPNTIPKEAGKKGGVRLGTLVLAFLFLFSFVPLIGFSFLTLRGILGQLSEIEAHEELRLTQDELQHLENKIFDYTQMIGFLSDLPAVFELLDRGEEVPGAISKNKAAIRYAGVLSRAFAHNQNVITLQILNLKGETQFSFSKEKNSDEYKLAPTTHTNFQPVMIQKILNFPGKELLLTPLFEARQEKTCQDGHCFLFQISTSILAKGEKIGIYVAEINISNLTREHPHIFWVLNDGCYLAGPYNRPTAFNDFPGLAKVIQGGKAGIYDFPGRGKMAWVPFLAGKDVARSLWGGKVVNLASVQHSRKIIYLNMALGLSSLLCCALVVSVLFSRYMQRLSTQTLISLERFVFEEKREQWWSRSKIKELDEFFQKMTSFMAQYTAIEEARRDSQSRLKQSEEQFRIVFNSVQSAVILIDNHDAIHFFNPAAERIFGYKAEEILGKKLHQLVVTEEVQATAHQGLSRFWLTGSGIVINQARELIAQKKDGSVFPVEVFVAMIKKDDEYWAVGAVMDITDRKAKEEKLIQMATTDSLTGVLNRRHFMFLAEQELIRSKRYQKEIFFLMFDLDHFKEINDTFGHEAGDQVLQHFAQLCRDNLRDSDIFGRLGGEEFAAILVETTAANAVAIAERIRENYSQLKIKIDGQEPALSVSIGINKINPDSDHLDVAYKWADTALYQAKQQGRNQVVSSWQCAPLPLSEKAS